MLRLDAKLILVVLLTLVVILPAGFYLVTERQGAELQREVKDSAKSLSEIIGGSVGESVSKIRRQRGHLQDLVLELSKLPGVQYVEVFDDSATVIAHTRAHRIGGKPSPLHQSFISEVYQTGRPIDEELPGTGKFNRFVPVFENGLEAGRVIGVIEVVLTLRDASSSQARGITTVVQGTISRILQQANDEMTALERMVEDVRRLSSVASIEVYNEEFMLLSRTSGESVPASPERLARIKEVFQSRKPHELDEKDAGTYERLTPVIIQNGSNGEIIGVVRLQMDLNPVLRNIETLSQNMRLIALVLMLAIFIVLSLALRRIVLEPVRVLSTAARKLTEGSFERVPEFKSRDEIAELGQSFNNMLSYIENYQQQLSATRDYNENILRTMGDALLVTSMDGRIERINDAALKLLEYNSKEDVIGLPISLICSEEPFYTQQSFQMWNVKDEVVSEEKYLITRTGSYVPALFSSTCLFDAKGEAIGLVCVARDITERKRVEAVLRKAHADLERRVRERTDELFHEKDRLQVTLSSIGDAVITTDREGRVDYLNPLAEIFTGWKSGEAAGHRIDEVAPFLDELSGEFEESPVFKCLSHGERVSISGQLVLVNRAGAKIAVESTTTPIRDTTGAVIGAVEILRDVSQERELRNQLIHQANHDALTGIANRNVFEKRLEKMLRQTRENHESHVVLFLDLDQFKVVNDTCGHIAGDALLQQLTILLREHMRASDTFARLGGDEFGVVLQSCGLEQGRKVARTLLDTVRDFRFVWENKTFQLGVSIGLVLVDEHSESLASVMSAADVACYAAKDLGRNRIHVYEASDEDLKQRHGEMQWVTMISKAIEEDRLVLYQQAICPIKDERAGGAHYEVLVRMLTEDGELIPPGAFLPAAERYNLTPAVDRWVIRRVFQYFGHMLKHGERSGDCSYAINISGLSISDAGFLDFIRQEFMNSGVPPDMICFEITETAAVANLTSARHFMRELRGMGCRFALDDFGCGVSSFSYLKNLQVDYLKIDGSFVRDMVEDSIDAAMVEAINNIGQVMGIRTIAEFVETEAILQRLRALGVDYAQGIYLDEPRPLKECACIVSADS